MIQPNIRLLENFAHALAAVNATTDLSRGVGHSAVGAATKENQAVDLVAFRDGLAVVMVITAPMRIHNFSTRRLGQEIKPDGYGWVYI